MKYVATLCAVLVLVAGCASKPQVEEPPVATAAQTPSLAFTDVTEQAGLGDFRHETGAEGDRLFPESMGSGLAFIDYDGDGWQDVLVAGGGTWPGTSKAPVPSVVLYRNEGDGTFSPVSDEAGLTATDVYSLGFAVADYDNDGDEDFFLSTLTQNRLYRNDGGVFHDVAREVGVAGEPVWSSASIFFDADRDGQLDLYVGNYVKWSVETDIFCTLDGETKDYCTPQSYNGVPGRFYHNEGDGTFTDRTEAGGLLPATGKALGVVELDFDRDGWPDLLVTNDTEPNQLFVNQGDGTFTERGMMSGVAFDENGKARAGMGIDVGVVDSTGEASIFIGHFTREMIGVWRHQMDGFFVDRAAVSKIGRPSLQTLTFGLFLVDADLDGDLDLFAANGHVNPGINNVSEGLTYAEPAHLFLNEGDGTFVDVVPEMGGPLAEAIVARGAAYADYDRDGDVDILVSTNAGRLHLWRNDLEATSYLRVHLEGQESNRNGLGTRIVAVVGTNRMERRVASGGSYLSASEQVATFGLAGHERVDSLIVHWSSGQTERFKSVNSGQDILLVEGAGSYRKLDAAAGASVAAVTQ